MNDFPTQAKEILLKLRTDQPADATALFPITTFVEKPPIGLNGANLIEDTHIPSELTQYRQPTFLDLEQPRGTEIVDMNQNGAIDAQPGDSNRIGTFALAGCTGVAVAATFPDGSRHAYVHHYDPVQGSAGADSQAILKEAANVDYGQATHVGAVIMIPGMAFSEPSDTALVDRLTDYIQANMGPDTTIEVAPYSAGVMEGENPYTRTLVVDIPDQGPPVIQPGIHFPKLTIGE